MGKIEVKFTLPPFGDWDAKFLSYTWYIESEIDIEY